MSGSTCSNGNGAVATTYEWDAVNRLRAVYPTFPESADDLKTTFAYDYRGRRVEKMVVAWDPNTENWKSTPETHRKFVWDGWKLLMELQCTQPDCGTGFQPVKKHTWGLDLSGQNGQINSLEAAGTIGGLLAIHDADASTGPAGGDGNYFVLSDANGNVGQLVAYSADVLDDAQPPQTLGTAWHANRLAAHYEYDPYGNVVTQAGPYAADNPIRFSTKYWDDETGLGYWGYRYYNPTLGRWMSRDPIGERGGANVYAYVSNTPVRAVDSLGLSSSTSQPAVDKTKACCIYHDTWTTITPYGAGITGGTCYQKHKCPPGATSPKDCCNPCSFSEMGISRSKRVLSADWGACCFCTLRRMRNPGFLGHEELEVSCPSSSAGSAFVFTLGRFPDGDGIYWPTGADIEFSPNPSIFDLVIEEKTIACVDGHKLKKEIEAEYPKSTSGNVGQKEVHPGFPG